MNINQLSQAITTVVDDVRHFIDLDLLAELWDELFLPEAVRRAWASPLPAHADRAAGR